ncbi:MAG: helix-turn-helix domain-containing protein [Bdellovibrionales bacterium]|nr:helix-turn-helix domain-containing protein [Bdellovibrionales bacterium]
MNTKTKIFGLSDLEKRLGKLTVGEFIATWRNTEGMSQRDLGKKIGISVSNLCDIEKGRQLVSPAKAEQIAKALKVPPQLLVRLALEEALREAGLKYSIDVKPAA